MYQSNLELMKLQQEQASVEQKLQQLQHNQQRLENRKSYYEKAMPGNGQKKTDCGVNTMDRSERKRKPGTKSKKPLGTKGALLYMICRHVVRPTEFTALTPECLGFFVATLRTRGCTPCARRRKVRSTPFPPCGENCVHSLAPPFPHKTGFVGTPYRYPCSNREQTRF